MLHFPDFPMPFESYHVKEGEHIPGHVMQTYMTDYAKKFGVYGRIRFKTRVDSVEATPDDKWMISATTSSSPPSMLLADKLVVATGLTNIPKMPEIAGMETFTKPLVHAKEALITPERFSDAKNVVVIGSGKSAFDTAYAQVNTNNVTVDMIIRKNGKGPVWHAPSHVTPFKRLLEGLVTTRLLQWFSPCTWGHEDGYGSIRSWLHGTRVGRFIALQFWNTMMNDAIQLNGYNTHPELKKLQPWYPTYYIGAQLSIQNYPTDFWELVKSGKIRPHIADITSITTDAMHLSNGETLHPDAIICATGWSHKSSIRFTNLSPQTLGLPYTSPEPEPLAAKADAAILAQFPSLEEQPRIPGPHPDSHPYRLYRFIVPPSIYDKHNLAFVGATSHTIKAIIAPVQALWTCAFFSHSLAREPVDQETLLWETMLHTQCLKWRYPLGNGALFPDMVFDALPYVDQCLADLGLQRWRKRGRVQEWISSYTSDDYRDLVDEWRERYGRPGDKH